jgi:hypothetical protein
MLNDALEPWEIIIYPLIGVGIILWNHWPPTFYWSQMWRFEVLLWTVAGVFEFFHWRRRIPLIARAILVGLPMSLTGTLVLPSSSRLMYWLVLGIFLYLGLLGFLVNRFDGWRENRKRH